MIFLLFLLLLIYPLSMFRTCVVIVVVLRLVYQTPFPLSRHDLTRSIAGSINRPGHAMLGNGIIKAAEAVELITTPDVRDQIDTVL